MRVTENNIGAAFAATCQGTTLYQSKFYFNLQRQLQIGDGAGDLRAFVISGCDIEGGAHKGATVYGVYVNRVDPLIIENSYFESSDSAASADIVVAGQSRIRITGVYSNANTTAAHAILLDAPTADVTIEDSYYFNSTGPTITNLNTGGRNVFLRNVAMNFTGATPSGRLFVSPAKLGAAGETGVNTAFFGSSIAADGGLQSWYCGALFPACDPSARRGEFFRTAGSGRREGDLVPPYAPKMRRARMRGELFTS